jgi:hypothetical protein
MDSETYRVDIAFEVAPQPPDPARLGRAATRLAELLPRDALTLRIEGATATPDGLTRVAARVHANGPAQALRDVSRALELIAAEVGKLDDIGPMRRCMVERVD